MKKFIFAIIVMMCILGVAACGPQKSQTIVSKELGIDASDGTEISCSDSHGGFLGDGMTFITLSFPDEKTAEKIKNNPEWRPFPLDETVKTLVYGISTTDNGENISIGPYLSDDGENAPVPEIQNGYYILIDRQEESDKAKEPNMLQRGSFNFTLGIYDTATNMLYYFRLDT